MTPLSSSKQRHHLKQIFDKAIEAVSPQNAVTNHLRLENNTLFCADKSYDLAKIEHIYILGAGKGAAPMVVALEKMLGERITKGLVCVKYDHSLPTTRVEIAEASHPVPDINGLQATTRMLAMAKDARESDLVICVITGGASALTPSFKGRVELTEVQELTGDLLACGASIDEINAVRKHISSFSGGKLALTAAPAQVLSLVISDVIGDNLSIIASGPTSPDSSTYYDAHTVLEKYRVTAPSSIKSYLQKGLNGKIAETVKSDNSIFERVQNTLVATNAQALAAAQKKAESLGYRVEVAPTMEGEARDTSKKLIEMARNLTDKAPTCLIAGGETTVTLKGNGLGGRNQEMALAASLELTEDEDMHCLFAGTDGTDGPTDGAGGFACPLSLRKIVEQNIDGNHYLAHNDAYHFLEQTESLLKTGPTRTNVMDIAIILII